MEILTVTEARKDLYRLVDQAAASHEPIFIKGRRAKAVLVSEEDWNSIQETLHLDSIPGMRESIVEGMKTPLEDCVKELSW